MARRAKKSLSEVALKKPSKAKEAEIAAEARAQHTRPEKGDNRGPIGYSYVLRIRRDGGNEMKMLAAKLDSERGRHVPVADLYRDAVNDFLKKHGRPPVA